jgi:O-antigen/teichoic acid export membrane protein
LFPSLALQAVQATDAKRDFLFGHYLGLRLLTTVLAFLVILGIVVISNYHTDTALVVLLIGLSKCFYSIGDIFLGLLQQHEKMDRIGKSLILNGILSFLVICASMYLTRNIVLATAGLAIVSLIVVGAYNVPSSLIVFESARLGALKPNWDPKTLVRLTRLAFPLGLAMMLVSLSINIPRYFVERQLGERELGLFAAMAYLITAGNTMVGALGQSASPRLSKFYAAGSDKFFINLMAKLVGIGAILGLIGIVIASIAGGTILSTVYGPEYAMNVDAFTWLMVAAAIGYVASFLSYGMTASRSFKIQPFIFALSALVSYAACAIFVPSYGMVGAAWAMILSLGLQLLLAFGVDIHAISVMERKSGER